ncbi:MAG: imelysin family protein [Flavobacteriales bacterium]
MRTPLLYISFGLIVLISAIAGCKKDDSEPTAPFDRRAMLVNYGQNIIIPAVSIADASTAQLNTAVTAFTASPNETTLAAAHSAWQQAYLDFMKVNSFNFGPGGEAGLAKSITEEVATWPANTALIEANIAAGNSALNDFNRDNRGFHGIDYLLFAEDAATTLAAFADANRRAYLTAVSNRLANQMSAFNAAWNNGYLAEFIGNTGTDVGSSTSQLYNEFVKSFEALKNFKVALPLGLRAGQTQAEPQLVEARYSALSLACLRAHHEALVDLWYGRNFAGTDGIGWREYIASVDGGDALIASTEAQLAQIDAALNALPDSPSFEAQIDSNFDALNTLHTRLQQHTRFFKSDMSSLLGITITFSSGDGD